jgi:hypothetical protein
MNSPVRPIAHPARISRNQSPLLMELRAARLRHDHGDGPCPFITEAIRMVQSGCSNEELATYLVRCGKPYSFVESLRLDVPQQFNMPFSGIDLESLD